MNKYLLLLLLSSIVFIASLHTSWLLQKDEDETTTQLNQRNAVGTAFSDNDSDDEDDQTFLSVRMTASLFSTRAFV